VPYRFAIERPDYSDLSSGRVFYSLPGHPAFPIRLASEIFQRCLAHRQAAGYSGPPALYDPCCGAAYLLSVLAYLHGPSIRALAASDVDPTAVELARRNLELLTAEGLDRRIAALGADYARFGKDSHRQALESACRLRERIGRMSLIPTRVFQADAGNPADILRGLNGSKVDLVITDIPYGRHSVWHGTLRDESHSVWNLLNALLEVLSPTGLVAVAADKAQKISHESYRRIERFSIGKRQVVILKPEN
jgi:hypothetical protein